MNVLSVRNLCRVAAVVVAAILAQPVAVAAQDGDQSGPKFMNLRYNEDFSYLDGADGSYTSDWGDPLKNITLGDDWKIDVGGEFRFRLESSNNIRFDALTPTHDVFQVYRFFLHANITYRDNLRFFIQGVHVFDEQRDLFPRGGDENKWDLHQAFVDVRLPGDCPIWLRVGRQELQYGVERLVSPLDWSSTRRRFDGVKLFASGETWDLDLWWTRLVPPQREHGDDWNQDLNFYGAYATYKGFENLGVDAYFFAIDDKGDAVNANGNAGDRSLYTLGTRIWGNSGPWDYDTEFAGQWGNFAGDTIQAFMWSVDGGYAVPNCPWSPRLGAGFDWATGDDNPTDGDHETFTQLFPLGHSYFGYLDLVGRQNIVAANLNVTVKPRDDVTARLALHSFWLTEDEDALYNSGGGGILRDATGSSGDEVGQELDLTIKWAVDAHSTVLLGWSHMFDGDFAQTVAPGGDPDLFYIQYALKF